MWTPLIVKAPGQRRGAIDDGNVTTRRHPADHRRRAGHRRAAVGRRRPACGHGRPRPRGQVDRRLGQAELRPRGDGDLVHIDGVEGFERVLATDPVEGTGPEAVWRRTEYGDLVGRDVDDLSVGAATGGDVDRQRPGGVGRRRRGSPAPSSSWAGPRCHRARPWRSRSTGSSPRWCRRGRRRTASTSSTPCCGPMRCTRGATRSARMPVDGPPDEPVLHAYTSRARPTG